MKQFPLVLLFCVQAFLSLSCSSSSDGDSPANDDTSSDQDRDLIDDAVDNCPTIYNPDQLATIGEDTIVGDACDDEDADSIADASDNCPLAANRDQLDSDGNGVGDACVECGRAKKITDLPLHDEQHVEPLAALGDKIFFSGRDKEYVRHLWIYSPQAVDDDDKVMELSDSLLSSASTLLALDEKLFFTAHDENYGRELWIYDPSSDDEVSLLADISPGPDGSWPDSLTVMEGKLYFSASDGIHGPELWAYDPDNASTGPVLVADINPTSSGSLPHNFMVHNGELFFYVFNDSGDKQLWSYKPSFGATFVANALLDTYGPPEGRTVALDGKIYFRRWRAEDDGVLWAYDLINRESGLSVQVQLPGLFTDDDVDDLMVFNNKLFLSYGRSGAGVGLELSTYDPTQPEMGVTLAADIYPGQRSSRYNYPEWYDIDMVELNGKLYMNAQNGEAGYELMAYTEDESKSHVRLVADINPGTDGSFPVNMRRLNDRLYFSADDGTTGPAMWEFDPACR